VVSGGSRREETEMRRDTVRKRRNRFRMTRLGVQGHIGRRGKSIKLWRIKKLMWHLRRVWGYKNGNNFVVPGFYGGTRRSEVSKNCTNEQAKFRRSVCVSNEHS